ncbi:hypothetical protein AB4Y90_15840 [Chryseobacterium sp. 2TAF14]|uniref:hypothetical protein n=1 Tax=Chryseobacterium sp. 2TAF14 TaxID=3233007 RepID=UPI003F8F0540
MLPPRNIGIILLLIFGIILSICINIFLYARTIIGFKTVLFFCFLGSLIFLIFTKIIKTSNVKSRFVKVFFCLFFGISFSTIILSTNYFFAGSRITLKSYNINEVSTISNPIINDQHYRIVYLEISPRDHKIFTIKADNNIEILDHAKSLQLKLSEGFWGFSKIEDFKIVLR